MFIKQFNNKKRVNLYPCVALASMRSVENDVLKLILSLSLSIEIDQSKGEN